MFTLRQGLLLVALLGVLLGILTPRIRETFENRRIDEDDRRLGAANADLTAAVGANDVARARRALAAGADPNRVVERTEFLHTCIVNGQVEMMELLLDYGGRRRAGRAISTSQRGRVQSTASGPL
jgi:hypothetical protein